MEDEELYATGAFHMSFISFPRSLIAARFDMWETGMDINEIVATARQHDIAIASSGVIHAYSKFEQQGEFYRRFRILPRPCPKVLTSNTNQQFIAQEMKQFFS